MPENETFEGSNLYDQSETFERYISHRKRRTNPNEIIEKPIIAQLSDDISGNVLDLGCGYGDLAQFLIEKGATSYLGIDASEKMIELGKSLIQQKAIQLIQYDIERWTYPANTYEWVISRLVLHYIKDLSSLFSKIHHTLKENGVFVFSVEHPVRTSSMHLDHPKGKKQDWRVDQYFNEGMREQTWMGNSVIKYHRTFETYWQLLKDHGFRIQEIREGRPESSHFDSEEEFERRNKIPLFLIIKAVKSHPFIQSKR